MDQGTPRGLMFIYIGTIVAIGLMIVGGALTWDKLDSGRQEVSWPAEESRVQE
jgi:hypothetical protein